MINLRQGFHPFAKTEAIYPQRGAKDIRKGQKTQYLSGKAENIGDRHKPDRAVEYANEGNLLNVNAVQQFKRGGTMIAASHIVENVLRTYSKHITLKKVYPKNNIREEPLQDTVSISEEGKKKIRKRLKHEVIKHLRPKGE